MSKGMEVKKARDVCREELGKISWKVKVLIC